jgi:S-disulfanyl-L-cysteine oxidoreductase SoxD
MRWLGLTAFVACGLSAAAASSASGCGRDASRLESGSAAVSAVVVDPNMFDVGRPLTEAERAQYAPSILPDGTGLPDGSATAAAGESIYKARCAICHGIRGEGATALPLVGGAEPAMGYRIGRAPAGQARPTMIDFMPYATTLFDYTQRTMPKADPGSLTAQDTYAVVAWMLYMNGLVRVDDAMDRRTLPRVNMPARARFATESR